MASTASSLSSDDDPQRFVGQVTPHRVVSPAIRRVSSLRDDDPFAEPGSDDSNMSASPTTERVARMKGFSKSGSSPLQTPLPRLLLKSKHFNV